MNISVELVSTVLLGMLALSAPPVLSVVLFRVLVKDGFSLDSQEFRRNCLPWSILWIGMFLVGLFLIFFGGQASMPDRLREASSMFEVNLIMGPFNFFLIFLFRKKYWLKVPHFIEKFPVHFFTLFIISWTVWFTQFISKWHWL